MQSAPDVFGKIVFSASIDRFKISSDDSSLNNSEIDAAAATQQAEDDPSPTPMGISESIVISNPLTFC